MEKYKQQNGWHHLHRECFKGMQPAGSHCWVPGSLHFAVHKRGSPNVGRWRQYPSCCMSCRRNLGGGRRWWCGRGWQGPADAVCSTVSIHPIASGNDTVYVRGRPDAQSDVRGVRVRCRGQPFASHIWRSKPLQHKALRSCSFSLGNPPKGYHYKPRDRQRAVGTKVAPAPCVHVRDMSEGTGRPEARTKLGAALTTHQRAVVVLRFLMWRCSLLALRTSLRYSTWQYVPFLSAGMPCSTRLPLGYGPAARTR